MLPPPGFGFSVGDFISGLNLLRELIKALEDSSGSSKEYRDLIRELYSLERALLEVKHLNVNESLQPHKNAIMQAAVQCQDAISFFLSQIAKYQPSLSRGGSGNKWRDCLRKIQWALCKKEDVQKFRAQIQGHTSSIAILLMTLKLNSIYTTSQPPDLSAPQSCCSHSNQIIQIGQSICENTSFLRVLPDLFSPLQRIMSANHEQASTSHSCDELITIVNEVRETNLQIYQMVLKMQTTLPPQVERQQPVYFLDACGFHAPFHLEFVNSWEAFIAVLCIKFKHRGLRAVEKKQYVLEDANRKNVIDMARPFEACFFPGQQVNMDACFDEKTDFGNFCPVCQHIEVVALDQAIDCSQCGTHYRRIKEVINQELPQPSSSSQERPNKRTSPEDDDHDKPDDEISQYRRIRLRSQKIVLSENFPPSVAKPYQQMYQACIPCRNREVTCDLGSVDNPHLPPCVSCRRENNHCLFSSDFMGHLHNEPDEMDRNEPPLPPEQPPSPMPMQAQQSFHHPISVDRGGSFRPLIWEYEAAFAPTPSFQSACQTSIFGNARFNTAHFGNPGFEPEQWQPDFYYLPETSYS